MYEYKMVQVPKNIGVKSNKHKGDEAANYLESVVNQYAADGWEFHRVDTINVSVLPGCLGSIVLSKQAQTDAYNVISFRRER